MKQEEATPIKNDPSARALCELTSPSARLKTPSPTVAKASPLVSHGSEVMKSAAGSESCDSDSSDADDIMLQVSDPFSIHCPRTTNDPFVSGTKEYRHAGMT